MRLLVVHPGSFYSTGDVYNGIVPELVNLGVEIHEYDLGARLEFSGRFLNMLWRQKVKSEKLDRKAAALAKYSQADVIYGASLEVLERALRFQVDGVLIFSGMFCHPNAFWLLKQAHIRTALILSESPYDDDLQARVLPLIECAWTNERSSVRTLRKANPNVNYMPHAFNPDLHFADSGRGRLDESEVPAHDVVFVGSLFAERVELLNQVDWTGIDLGLYGEWSGLPGRHKLRKFLRGGVVDNKYSAALYRKAKIGLNLYRESMGWGKNAPRITHAESMNPRAYELAACGCFQISQDRAEIGEILGNSVATFGSPAQLQFAINHYLKFPEQRQERVTAALQRVQGHTFAARARTIVDDLGRAEWPVPTRELVAAG